MDKDCPICHKIISPAHKPFCSKRCADLDLARWFKGAYAVPATEQDDEPDDLEIKDDLE